MNSSGSRATHMPVGYFVKDTSVFLGRSLTTGLERSVRDVVVVCVHDGCGRDIDELANEDHLFVNLACQVIVFSPELAWVSDS